MEKEKEVIYEVVIERGYRDFTFRFDTWFIAQNFIKDVINSCVDEDIDIKVSIFKEKTVTELPETHEANGYAE